MMRKQEHRTGIVGGLAWTFGERILSQLVSAIVGIILARILMPEEYGIIAIVMVFISFCDVFVTSGFASAIVQKKEVSEEDYNTAFILSFGMSIILYAILFIAAPFIANAYEMPLVSATLRVLGLRLMVSAYNSIQQAYIRRAMDFKRFFVVTFGGTLISGIVGIAMAYGGFGVWALVAQYLTSAIASTLLTCLICKWRPRNMFSMSCAGTIFHFGWKVLCTRLVSTLQNDIRSLIVGKVFGSAELAYYDQAKKYPDLLMNNVNISLSKVMLPVFARLQDDLSQLKNTLRKAIRIGMYIVAPLLIGLCAVSDVFVKVILTDKWMSTVPMLQLFCIMYLTRPLEEMSHQAVIAVGRSDLALKIMIAINITALIMVTLAVFLFKSVLFMAILAFGNTLVSVVGFMRVTKRLFGYQIIEQMHDIIPSLAIAVVMGVVVASMKSMTTNPFFLLFAQVFTGIGIYIVLSIVCKNDSFMYLKDMLLKFLTKNK